MPSLFHSFCFLTLMKLEDFGLPSQRSLAVLARYYLLVRLAARLCQSFSRTSSLTPFFCLPWFCQPGSESRTGWVGAHGGGSFPDIFFYYVPLPAIHVWSMLTLTADGWGTSMRASEAGSQLGGNKTPFRVALFRGGGGGGGLDGRACRRRGEVAGGAFSP